MRLLTIALAIALSWPTHVAAQDRPPTQNAWSPEGREPQWRARFEAREGVVDTVSILQRDAGGAVFKVIESRDDKRFFFIERRDRAGQMVWRHPLPGVPERTNALDVIAVKGKTRADLTLVAYFNPTDAKPRDAFARIIEVDIRSGAMRVAGGFPYPGKKRATTDDWMELTHAKALPSGLIVFYGGVGSGPFFWWVGLRKPDGTVIWDVVSQRGLGHVVDLRQDGDAFEVIVVNVMSLDQERGIGTFRVRIDASGRIVGSAKLWQRESGPRFLPDGGMAQVVHSDNQPSKIQVIDRFGRRRFERPLPDGVYGLDYCLEDGAIAFSRDKEFLILAADGNSMMVIPNDGYRTEMLPDGAILRSQCEGEKCAVQTLSLFERPR